MRIAVDAMGGDRAPGRPVDGALAAALFSTGHTGACVVAAHAAFGMLPGVAGLCIVGHGRSSVKAVRNAVAMASRLAGNDMVERLRHEMAIFAVTQS